MLRSYETDANVIAHFVYCIPIVSALHPSLQAMESAVATERATSASLLTEIPSSLAEASTKTSPKFSTWATTPRES